MEENANVVVKLLIRRPECFGPALRGEGGQGLLAAMKEAIKISEDPALDLPETPAGFPTGLDIVFYILHGFDVQKSRFSLMDKHRIYELIVPVCARLELNI